jgi:molybdopterin/thiamine biosynthesis adenylyltransferase
MAVVEHAWVMKRNPALGPVETITLVGAGGIGARMVPLLVKMLPEGGTINVIDPDTVQPRNLWRQHFTEDDLGQPKAEVMAARYHGERGVSVAAYVDRFKTVPRGTDILVGAVDNRTARLEMLQQCSTHIYVDVGNLTDRGQVLLQASGSALTAVDPITGVNAFAVRINARDCMPEIFDPTLEDPEEEGCARPDLQTVAINSMAAAVAANVVYILINRVPFWAAGWFFTPLSCEVIKPEVLRAPTVARPYDSLQCRGVWHGK